MADNLEKIPPQSLEAEQAVFSQSHQESFPDGYSTPAGKDSCQRRCVVCAWTSSKIA